jgi:ATP-dependent RNA helicase DeaD
MDHLQRKTFNTTAIRICILDEADRMLDMGFREDMEIILDKLPKEHQTLFFSATMNREVKSLIHAYSKDAEQVSIERKALTVDTVEQTYYEVRNRSKIEVLCRILDMEIRPRGIVFCNTKQMVETVTEALVARGYACDRIHGDITQNNRERVIRKFKDGSIELLIATDVAARGLDIDDVDLVFNYDLPYDPEDYVHRIGRTGRAGRSGKSVTFVYGRDIYRLEAIERYTRHVVRRMPVPSLADVEGRKENKIFNQVRSILEESTYKNYDAQIDRLLDAGHTPTDISSALFSLLSKTDDSLSEPIAEDTEPYSDKPQSIEREKKNPRKRGRGNRGNKPFRSKRNPENRSRKPRQF